MVVLSLRVGLSLCNLGQGLKWNNKVKDGIAFDIKAIVQWWLCGCKLGFIGFRLLLLYIVCFLLYVVVVDICVLWQSKFFLGFRELGLIVPSHEYVP
jgi:hypothetical protein